jgi:protein JBTS26
MRVCVGDVEVTPADGIIVRKAPGNANFDFGQFIPLATTFSPNPAIAATDDHVGQGGFFGGAAPSSGFSRTVDFSAPPSRSHETRSSWVAGAPTGTRKSSAALWTEPVTDVGSGPSPSLLDSAPVPSPDMFGVPRVTTAVRQQYLTPVFPSGCMFKFVFSSTWGDVHYLGLNGLELYDESGDRVRVLGVRCRTFHKPFVVLCDSVRF